MSATSKKRSARRKPKKIDAPFDPSILAEAEALAGQYRLVIESDPDGGGFAATVLELPNVFGWGQTVDECVTETRELLESTLAVMLEDGVAPPDPSAARRSEQVNIRLTPLEKARLEGAARSKGFRGLSDFVRSRALDGTAPDAAKSSRKRSSKQSGAKKLHR